MRYLQHPSDLAALPKEEAWLLGLFREGTYDEYYRKALEAGFATPRLIVTIPRKSGSTSTVAVGDVSVTFEPGDQCYPINQDEWDLFQGDEPKYCRTPMMVWAVDRTKYAAPI